MIRETFIECIQSMSKAQITYRKKDKTETIRTVAPTDIWPWENPKGGFYDNWIEKFRFYDFNGSSGGHMTPKNFEDIISIEKLNEHFLISDLPEEVLDKEWYIKRDWNA